MLNKVGFRIVTGLSLSVLLLSACGTNPQEEVIENVSADEVETEVIKPHKDLNQDLSQLK